VSTEQTEETGGRRRRHLPVVAVAAAVLLAGGGGAWWASAASGGGSAPAASDKGAPPPLVLDDLGSPSAGRGDVTGIAPGEPNPYGTRFQAAGDLPDGPGEAAVYRTGTVTKSQVARLAKALGMSQEPRRESGGWRVGGGQDGTGPVLTVGIGHDAGSWTFDRYGHRAPGCMRPLPKTGASPAPGAPRSERPKPSCPNQAAPGGGGVAKGEPVPEQQAEQAVQPVLEPLGLRHAKLGPAGTEGAKRLVSANPVVDGLPTVGWSSTFTVGADGTLDGGHGRLGDPEKGATYPVLTAAQTLKRLNGPRGGGTHGVAPGEPDPSGAQSGKPETAQVTKARFGLETHFSHGTPVLVPSWSFTVRRAHGQGTFTVGYPAVKPSLLQLPGDPQGPSPRPSAPRGRQHVESPTSYTADGRTLTLTFWGGLCSDYRGTAQETDTKVKVSVRATDQSTGRMCPAMAKRESVHVTLKRPLGGRTVVDAGDGKPVPEAAKH
jgi:hypothetical protein